MKLVIVQTPSQAQTLTDVLGEGWRVEPCYSMVRDLPIDQLGVDVENDFRPTLTIMPGKGNLVRRLMPAIRDCAAVYVATPPTHAGETMAWHILALSPDVKDKPVYRVTLPALTPDAIRAAFAAPRPLDIRQIEAHMTRRLIERLVNWGVNGQAEQQLGFRTALTYDGMIALRLVAERAAEIGAFTPATRWRTSVSFVFDGVTFTAHVVNVQGALLSLRNEEQARKLELLLHHGKYWVDKTAQTLKTQPAPEALTLPALITTTERDLGLPPERVLALVGMLYNAGWITHPNAELPISLSDAAQAYIRREFGTDYLNVDALVRVGIAPTDVNRVPEDLPGDGAALYALVWKHFIAAHIPPAQDKLIGARIRFGSAVGKPDPLELRAILALPYFDGWQRVLPASVAAVPLVPLKEGETLKLADVTTTAVTSAPPARLTAATLVGALVNNRLTVQAASSAVEGVIRAEYVAGGDALTLTERGRVLTDALTEMYGDLTSPAYAADLHAEIDRIAAGEQTRLAVLRAFWSRFGGTLRPVPAARVAAEHKPIVLRPAEEV